jgi:hypothetical protein
MLKRLLFINPSQFVYPKLHHSVRTLPYILPGLDEFEENYVRKQVDIILTHDYKSTLVENDLMLEYSDTFKNANLKTTDLLPVKRVSSLLDEIGIKGPNQRQFFYDLLLKFNRPPFVKHSDLKPHPFSDLMGTLLTMHKDLLVSLVPYDKEKALKKIVAFIKNAIVVKRHSYKTRPKIHTSVNEIFIDDELNFKNFAEELKILNFTIVEISEQTNLMRNLYILTRIFGVQLKDVFIDNQNTNQRIQVWRDNLRTVHALEVLIQVNVYDQLLLQDVTCNNQKKMYFQRLLLSVFYPVISVLKLRYDLSPVLYYSALIRSLGVDLHTVRNLFLTSLIPKFLYNIDKVMWQEFDYDFLSAQKCLSERNQIMEEIDSSTELSKVERLLAIFLWANLNHVGTRTSLSSVKAGLNSYLAKQISRWEGNGSYSAHICSIITNSFGEPALDTLHRAVCFRPVDSQYAIIVNLNLLESLAFTKEQIRSGIEVLVYPPVQVQDMITNMDSQPQDFPGFNEDENWRSDPNALHLVSYYIEQSEGFRTEKIVKTQSSRTLIRGICLYQKQKILQGRT